MIAARQDRNDIVFLIKKIKNNILYILPRSDLANPVNKITYVSQLFSVISMLSVVKKASRNSPFAEYYT
jgi:hypothetical protein